MQKGLYGGVQAIHTVIEFAVCKARRLNFQLSELVYLQAYVNKAVNGLLKVVLLKALLEAYFQLHKIQ